MTTVGTAQSGNTTSRQVRHWVFRRNSSGADGPGHVAAILCLIGLAGYAVVVASVSVGTVPDYKNVALRTFALVGWLIWAGSYVWSVVWVLRGRRHDRSIQIVSIVAQFWSVLLFLVLGQNYAAPAAMSFSVMVLCLSGRARGIATTALLLVYFWLTTREFHTAADIKRNILDFGLSSLVFYSIPRLVIFAGELEDTKSELAQLAVSEQRLRWARDLHDTLGHGLSVVVLKLELVERLSEKDPERAINELRDARTLVRESIGEMQTVVAGMRDVSLRGEIANACTILNSAGVRTTTEIVPVVLDNQVAEALAWIVREGSTNVLRHSNSTHCDISLRVDRGRAVLTLTNDGPAIKVTRAPSGGHGIRGMRERLNTLGGRLTAKSEKDGGFVLEASVPLPSRTVTLPAEQPVISPPSENADQPTAAEVER
jgi:two-component system, NarL family, sensor histidine kinase DesK